MTSIEWLIEELEKEIHRNSQIQDSSNLYGSEIKGRLIALNFAKKKSEQAKEMYKQEISEQAKEMHKQEQDNILAQRYIEGYNKAKENLYTEEQVREAMEFARGHHKMTDTQFIQLQKQPKKD
jgi:hypothetical protein